MMIPGIMAQRRISGAPPASVYPEIRAVVPITSAAKTTHSITIGNDLHTEIGDRMFVSIAVDTGPSVSAYPAGWDFLYTGRTPGELGNICLWKDKTVSNETASIVLASSSAVAISQWALSAGTFTIASNPVSEGNTTTNPPLATDPLGSGKQLVVASIIADAGPTISAYPLANNQTIARIAGVITSGICTVTAETATYDPGAFTLSAAVAARSVTIMQRGT